MSLNDSLSPKVAPCPRRGLSNFLYLSLGERLRLPYTARINDPCKLTRYSSHGMAPELVPLRPSSEVTNDPPKLARYLFEDGG